MSSPRRSKLATEIADLLAAVLRGEVEPWPTDASEDLPTRVFQVARLHGVHGLAVEMFHRVGSGRDWPAGARALLAAEARAEAMAEPLRYVELQRVLAALDEAGVRPLLLKGAHLAYACYPSPHLRPCSDIDLLISEAHRTPTRKVMEELGYQPGAYMSGELVTHQFHYERRDLGGLRHEFDIHWKILNPQLFAAALSFEELTQAAVPIPALGPVARGLAPRHALLLACIHRVAHHHNSQRLIWLCDIHLLVSSMHADELKCFAELAAEKRMRAVCASGLELAERRLGTRIPSFVVAKLSAPGRRAETEPSAAFLTLGRRKLDILISDLRYLPGWRSRLHLLREHLFPAPEYLLRTRNASPTALPFFYAVRIALGAARWFRRAGQ